MPKHRNPLHSRVVSGKMSEVLSKGPVSVAHTVRGLFATILVVSYIFSGLFKVFAAPVSEKDSVRAVELYGEGKFWLQKGGPDRPTRLGNYETARRFYREALQVNPDFADPHNGLGWALYYSDSLEDAIREFKIMKNMKPWHRDPYFGLGLVYKKAKKWKQAERELRMAIDKCPEYYAHECKGDKVKGLTCTRGDLDYRSSMVNLSEVLVIQGKIWESRIWSDSAASLKKKYPQPGIGGLPLPPPIGRVSIRVLGFARDSLLFYTLPQLVDTPKIEYPPIARQVGIEATVKLLLSIGKKGEVVNAQISRSGGYVAVDEAAKGITKAKFSPPRLKRKLSKGALPACDLIVEVTFKLDK